MSEDIVINQRSLVLILGLALIFVWFNSQNSVPAAQLSSIDSNSQILIIPRLKLSAPIIYVDSNSEDMIQENLEQGIVHLFQTARPGEVGNCYIVGHSSDYPGRRGNYKTVFARLPQLQIGDELQISDAKNNFHYRVAETKVVEAEDLTVLSQETQGQKILTLQTSYPIGTARQRFLVIARFVEK